MAEATFSTTDALLDNGVYRRTGKVFEVGSYPDKNFVLNTEEARAAVSAFQPLLNKGAHVPTIFDGKMGTLEKVELAEDGVTLNGVITVPKWLQDLHGAENPLQASLEWDRATKRIVGATLVPNPRVADSALMAAFSAAEKPADGGEVVSFIDTLKTLLGIEKKEEKVEMGKTEVTIPVVPAGESQETINLRKQVADLLAKDRARDAAAFANALYQSRHIVPAQVPAVTAVFEAAIGVSEAAGTVTFAGTDGVSKTVGLLEAIRTAFSAAPQHQFTTEQIQSGLDAGNIIPLSNGAQDKDDPDGSKAAATKATEWAKRNGPSTAAVK